MPVGAKTACAFQDITFTVQGLFEDHKYEFRVSAVNENGIGPSLMCEEPIIAKLPFSRRKQELVNGTKTEYALNSSQINLMLLACPT